VDEEMRDLGICNDDGAGGSDTGSRGSRDSDGSSDGSSDADAEEHRRVFEMHRRMHYGGEAAAALGGVLGAKGTVGAAGLRALLARGAAGLNEDEDDEDEEEGSTKEVDVDMSAP
jgi:hypothetical protein